MIRHISGARPGDPVHRRGVHGLSAERNRIGDEAFVRLRVRPADADRAGGLLRSTARPTSCPCGRTSRNEFGPGWPPSPILGRTEPLFEITDKNTADMIRKDLEAARNEWMDEAMDEEDRKQREQSSFLAYVDEHGPLRRFPRPAEDVHHQPARERGFRRRRPRSLARHSDINLTMNTYTMLGVLDQVAAVEALPPVPECKPRLRLRATGT